MMNRYLFYPNQPIKTFIHNYPILYSILESSRFRKFPKMTLITVIKKGDKAYKLQGVSGSFSHLSIFLKRGGVKDIRGHLTSFFDVCRPKKFISIV